MLNSKENKKINFKNDISNKFIDHFSCIFNSKKLLEVMKYHQEYSIKCIYIPLNYSNGNGNGL
ncbi:hypothetical protein AELL_2053 [Arcobacter ellisii]|uniref:Uncharacterized protein n=1 Tax=Arcobacter ellisii TaxID=913109 RepID=A0A347UA19_9BACT|nr:hypothetical protein AELL_2053 [Arcobacter ellisii]RXI31430.1 hypothetical protein CP962_04780 [Arcobacter ellisii]